MTMTVETAFTNARIVLADQVLHGSLVVRDGHIAEIGTSTVGGEDLDGDYLIPGLVELHTDHLEGHYSPRPGVRQNPVAALQAHDAQIAASGITTVFDALRVGTDERSILHAPDMVLLANAIDGAAGGDRLRAEHFIHLRCEVSAPDCAGQFAALVDGPRVKLVSMMDHAPGQRQFTSIETYRAYHMGKLKMSVAEFEDFIARRVRQSAEFADRHRQHIAAFCRAHTIPMASHDDATIAHVAESEGFGVAVAEFPTSVEAARASHKAGLAVLMGAPNLVRGGSHSGNVSAQELAEAGYLDILSSDYVPFSLIQAAFLLDQVVDAISLPDAIAMVSKHPAESMGLTDRGELVAGRRADMVQVRVQDGIPIVRAVWREGRRVA